MATIYGGANQHVTFRGIQVKITWQGKKVSGIIRMGTIKCTQSKRIYCSDYGLPPFCYSFSQAGQDVFLDQVLFKSKLRNGFFIEAGAFDLVTHSNTLFFEMERGWTGILVEPVLWETR